MTHSAENDRTLLTRWDVPCPKCKAQPGQPCRRPNGDKVTGYSGESKFHAARKGRVIPPGKGVSPPESAGGDDGASRRGRRGTFQ